MSTPLATGNLYGRTWRVHRAVAEGVGTFPSAYLEWSYEGEAELRQARNWALGEDGKVWDRASTRPEVAVQIARAEAAWVETAVAPNAPDARPTSAGPKRPGCALRPRSRGGPATCGSAACPKAVPPSTTAMAATRRG